MMDALDMRGLAGQASRVMVTYGHPLLPPTSGQRDTLAAGMAGGVNTPCLWQKRRGDDSRPPPRP